MLEEQPFIPGPVGPSGLACLDPWQEHSGSTRRIKSPRKETWTLHACGFHLEKDKRICFSQCCPSRGDQISRDKETIPFGLHP